VDDAGTRRAPITRPRRLRYNFRVIASNGDGDWNEAEIGGGLEFRVLPLGTRPWCSGLCHRVDWRARGCRRQRWSSGGVICKSQETLKGRYEATLAERARIAQELHDTLLQGFTGIRFNCERFSASSACGRRRESSRSTARWSAADTALRDGPEFDLGHARGGA